MIIPALPTLIRDVWHQGAWLYGLYSACSAVGAIVGMLIFSHVKPRRRGVACFPADKLGRVFSLDQLGSLALVPIGLALAGVISDRTNPLDVFVLAGAIKIGTSLVGLSLRGVRELR